MGKLKQMGVTGLSQGIRRAAGRKGSSVPSRKAKSRPHREPSAGSGRKRGACERPQPTDAEGRKASEHKGENGITLRIMSWNIDGLNGIGERRSFATSLRGNAIDIAGLTELHLRDEDVGEDRERGAERLVKLLIDHYEVVNCYNRLEMGMIRSGGVLIIARVGIDFTAVSRRLLPAEPISCCSVAVQAADGLSSPFRLTGIGIPPPLTLRMSAELLSSPTCNSQ